MSTLDPADPHSDGDTRRGVLADGGETLRATASLFSDQILNLTGLPALVGEGFGWVLFPT